MRAASGIPFKVSISGWRFRVDSVWLSFEGAFTVQEFDAAQGPGSHGFRLSFRVGCFRVDGVVVAFGVCTVQAPSQPMWMVLGFGFWVLGFGFVFCWGVCTQ